MADIINYANLFAAEHLQIQCGKQSRQIAKRIKNAGAIFIGDYSPVAVGDYWAGPSHTLPTGTSAIFQRVKRKRLCKIHEHHRIRQEEIGCQRGGHNPIGGGGGIGRARKKRKD